jgi:hypothetical protein
VSQFHRCPLRQSQRLALVELGGTLGFSRLAAKIGTNLHELHAVCAGTLAPTLTDRSNIIRELIRAQLIGRAVGDYSDQHAPTAKEPLEAIGTAKQQRQDRASFAPRDRGQENI